MTIGCGCSRQRRRGRGAISSCESIGVSRTSLETALLACSILTAAALLVPSMLPRVRGPWLCRFVLKRIAGHCAERGAPTRLNIRTAEYQNGGIPELRNTRNTDRRGAERP